MASVREIAKRAGVSVTTVSRALNAHPDVSDQTRQRVVRAANRAGYTIPRGPRTATAVGFVLTGDFELSEYDSFLLYGIARGLREQKLDITLIHLQRDKLPSETYSQFFARRGLLGGILRTNTRYRHICEAIADEGLAHVVVAEKFEHERVNYICCDSTQESRRAVEHLIHLGHRRIAMGIAHEPDHDHLDRRAGYEAALREAGLEVDPDLIVPMSPTVTGGENAINRALSLPNPPTAMFLADPMASLGAVCRVQALGLRIPEDFSIVGFDDGTSRRRIHPRLTAVWQDTVQLGFDAALWLGRRIAGTASPERLQMVFSAVLEINQTTGEAPSRPVRMLPDGRRVDGPGDPPASP